MAVIVLPEAEAVVRSWLVTVPEVTALAPANRILVAATPEGITWSQPAIRLTNVAAYLDETPEWCNSAEVQLDCFATSDAQASLLARTVHGALVAMRDEGYATTAGRVVGVDFRLGPTSLPDETRTPPLARWLIRAVVHVTPA